MYLEEDFFIKNNHLGNKIRNLGNLIGCSYFFSYTKCNKDSFKKVGGETNEQIIH